MSDPLVHRHDPAANTPPGGAAPGARAGAENPESRASQDAARVVTLAQLLATEATDSPPPAPAGADAPLDANAEYGGPLGPEPTRYGDWEKGGRCIDF